MGRRRFTREFKLCRVAQATWPVPGGQGRETQTKVWVADEVPGGVVQMQFTGGGGREFTFLLKSFQAK